MGLFSKKKAAVEQRQNQKTSEIVCRHCFKAFLHSGVLFRAVGAGNDVDDILEGYRYAVGLPEAGYLPAVLYPDEFSETKKGYSRGILISLTDEFERTTTNRICPYCHNILHKTAGFLPSTIISVLGPPNSGKSTFFWGLVRTLASQTSRNFSLDISPTPDTWSTGTSHKRGMRSAVCIVSVADLPDIALVYFDMRILGRDPVCADIYTAHIKKSSGVLFMVDPVMFRTTEEFFAPETRKVDYAPAEVIGGVMMNAIANDVPVGAVLTKADLLRRLAAKTSYIRPKSKFFQNHSHRKRFGMGEFLDVHTEVEDFLADVDPDYLYALKARFKELGLFVASNEPDANPMRVDESFLWLLYRLGFIEGYRRG